MIRSRTARVLAVAVAMLATVQVDLSDNLRPTFLRLSAGVMGPAGSAGAPLRSRITRARLVTEAGELLAEIPTGTSTLYVDAVVALDVNLPSDAEYARVRSALLTARARRPRDRPPRTRAPRDDAGRRARRAGPDPALLPGLSPPRSRRGGRRSAAVR